MMGPVPSSRMQKKSGLQGKRSVRSSMKHVACGSPQAVISAILQI